jgi:hypothetical protein
MSNINSPIDTRPASEGVFTSDGHHVALLERIAQRAYALYEGRGCAEGFDLRDWLEAEREVLMQEGIH